MKALKEKWNSRRGATILLALLFLLVCMMVGASVLAAAASNAGKIKSNKEEQQKYLTLSSAMNLLIDELESVEYVGRYSYKLESCAMATHAFGVDHAIRDADGRIISYLYDNHRTYTQQTGALRQQIGGGETWLDGVLPFVNDLDYIFNGQFDVPWYERTGRDLYIINSLSEQALGVNAPTPPAGPYTLEFSANADADYGGLTDDKVRVEVTLRNDGSILLTATLLEPDEIDKAIGEVKTWKPTDYTMEALLRPDPDDWPEKRLVLPNDPDPTYLESTYYRTEPIRWKLEYIFKKEADPSATPTPT